MLFSSILALCLASACWGARMQPSPNDAPLPLPLDPVRKERVQQLRSVTLVKEPAQGGILRYLEPRSGMRSDPEGAVHRGPQRAPVDNSIWDPELAMEAVRLTSVAYCRVRGVDRPVWLKTPVPRVAPVLMPPCAPWFPSGLVEPPPLELHPVRGPELQAPHDRQR